MSTVAAPPEGSHTVGASTQVTESSELTGKAAIVTGVVLPVDGGYSNT